MNAKDDDTPSPAMLEFLEQKDHERMKVWMLDHRWSINVFCFDPADLYEVLEAEGIEDIDIDTLIELLTTKHKDT